MYTIELHNNIEMWVRVEEHNRAFASASQSTSAPIHPSSWGIRPLLRTHHFDIIIITV